ncbi:hypothetical protein DM02DRAFT_369541 [Periconia macrospinosa]|uniref:Uncharacterized protein n=1 Tax=Periconia macrospinosa TaxID=97972 RepID=A0A2V1CZC7_9PLEO|nr:hypothetical protein DM02DRAFT_369541 [Periconia macrospinosa]
MDRDDDRIVVCYRLGAELWQRFCAAGGDKEVAEEQVIHLEELARRIRQKEGLNNEQKRFLETAKSKDHNRWMAEMESLCEWLLNCR